MFAKILWRSFLIGLFLSTILLWSLVFTAPDQASHLYVFDVGQGDSIFIKTNTGKKILIDGGPSNAVLYQLGKVLPFYERNIDLLISTHPHADHLTGLLDILNRYKIKHILDNGQTYTSPEYKAWSTQTGGRLQSAEPRVLYQDQWNSLEVLYPPLGPKKGNPNESAIVIKFTAFQHPALLMSDAGFTTENYLLSRCYSLDSEILKVGHQGSRSSSSKAFLQNVTPQDSIISVGKDNHFGHPAPQVLEKLNEIGSRIWRTDRDGTIEVVFHPQNYQIRACSR